MATRRGGKGSLASQDELVNGESGEGVGDQGPDVGRKQGSNAPSPQSKSSSRRRAGKQPPRRSTQRRLQKHNFLQGRFHSHTFARMFAYHAFFPLSLPFALLYEGTTACANMQFIYVARIVPILNSFLVPAMVWGTVVLQILAEHEDTRVHLLFSVTMLAYFSRVTVIALKYSLLSPVEYARFTTRRLHQSEFDEWHMHQWFAPTPRLLRTQLQQVALRRDMSAPERREIWFTPKSRDDLLEMLSTGPETESLLGPDYVTTLNLVIAMFTKVDMGNLHIRRVNTLLGMPVPLTLVVSFLVDPEKGTVNVYSITLCVLCTLTFVYVSSIFTHLMLAGVKDYQRRAKLLAMYNKLINVRTQVSMDADGNPVALRIPPLITLGFSHNIRQLLQVRALIKQMGHMYRKRIQVVIALYLLVMVLIVFGIVVSTIVGWRYSGLASALAVYVLMTILVAAASIIVAGGNANDSVDACRTAFLLGQVELLRWLEYLRNHAYSAKLAELRAEFAEHTARQGTDSVVDVANPLHAEAVAEDRAAVNADEKQMEETRRLYQDDRLQAVSAEEVRAMVDMVSNAVDFLDHTDEMFPIKFLGLRARFAVLVTAGTLVISASSVGLRNIAQSIFDYIQREVGQ